MDYNHIKIQLGAAIRREREAQDISQRRLALMCGTSQSYIKSLELGRINIGFVSLYRVASALDTTIGELTDGIDADNDD